eukprot:6488749-Amphidinium_carterae.1
MSGKQSVFVHALLPMPHHNCLCVSQWRTCRTAVVLLSLGDQGNGDMDDEWRVRALLHAP